MVITSTTQWTIPLSSSSLSASSPPASTRQSSVLGLKSCQLSAPQHAVNSSLEPRRHSHHQDLHSTSSRRLQGAENVISRRSAGSFRQLVPDAFFAKVGREGLRSREMSHNKEFECKYDGIAMPSPLHAPDVGKAAGAAVCGNLIDVHGEITADDVDLLPMPGLSSCPSPFAIDSVYVSGSQSPKHSRNVELASPESSGSSSKSGFSVPNYLGLPPEFHTGLAAENKASEYAAGLVDGLCHTRAPRSPLITIETAKYGGSNPPQIGRAQDGRDVDNFPDSLAGLWAIPAGADCMLHDSESLASIFNVYPQNFHGFPSIEQSFDTGNTESAQCIMDGFQCLVNLSKENREEKGKIRDVPHGLSSGLRTFSVKGLGSSIMLGADSAHGNPCAVFSNPNVSELKGSVQASASDVSAVSYASSLSHSRSYAGPPSPLKNVGEAISLKRPFSALDLVSMASSDISTGSCITGSKLWFSTKGMATKGHDELKGCGPSLYDFPNDCTLPGNLHHHFTAKSGGSVKENMLPKPPPAKIRRKHGTAMDPQSVAARTRREKFSDRIRVLQSLVPNGERLDTVSMLSQTLEYVKFLQHQVWHLYHGKDPASVTDTCEKWREFVEAAPASAN